MVNQADLPSFLEYESSIENLPLLGKGEIKNYKVSTRYSRGSGQNCRVYPVVDTSLQKTKIKALRVWTNKTGEAESNYQKIKKYLSSYPGKKEIHAKAIIKFNYLREGIHTLPVKDEINAKWKGPYPVLLMDWVKGAELHEFIINCRKKNSPEKILELTNEFKNVIFHFHKHRIAHGDLQNGNILIINIKDHPKIRFVDYDGMYVPGLDEEKLEGAVDHFQHKNRNQISYRCEKQDYFSELVIYLSLLIYGTDPSLIDERIGQANLFFHKTDFDLPDKDGNAFTQIRENEILVKNEVIQKLADYLQEMCREEDPLKCESLENLLSKFSVNLIGSNNEIAKDYFEAKSEGYKTYKTNENKNSIANFFDDPIIDVPKSEPISPQSHKPKPKPTSTPTSVPIPPTLSTPTPSTPTPPIPPIPSIPIPPKPIIYLWPIKKSTIQKWFFFTITAYFFSNFVLSSIIDENYFWLAHGVIIAVAQWLAIREEMNLSLLWVPMSILGLLCLFGFKDLGLSNFIITKLAKSINIPGYLCWATYYGLIIGACQANVFFLYPSKRSTYWILFSGIASGCVALITFYNIFPTFLTIIIEGLVYSVITAFSLTILKIERNYKLKMDRDLWPSILLPILFSVYLVFFEPTYPFFPQGSISVFIIEMKNYYLEHPILSIPIIFYLCTLCFFLVYWCIVGYFGVLGGTDFERKKSKSSILIPLLCVFLMVFPIGYFVEQNFSSVMSFLEEIFIIFLLFFMVTVPSSSKFMKDDTNKNYESIEISN